MDQPQQPGEIHRADPAYRRQMWTWFAQALVSGAIALFALNAWLDALRADMSLDRGLAFQSSLQRVLAGVCLLLAALAIGFGLWLRRIGEATRQERRWPPSAMRTSQDVRIRYLTSADALVAQFKAGAWALFATAAGLVAWAAWLLF